MTDVSALIARLEKATGPDRELDAEIHAHLNGGYVEAAQRPSNRAVIWNRDNGFYKEVISGHMTRDRKMVGFADQSPAYSSSLDAALTLVPEGSYGFAVPHFYSEYDRFEERRVYWRGHVLKPIWEKASPIGDDYFERHESGNAVSPAIALCIASLRARKETP